jgi:hypothetical protein
MATDQRHDVAQGVHVGTLPIVLMVAAVLIGLAALLPLVQSSGSTSTSGRISQLQRERQDWQAQLQEEELKIARIGSLAHIQQEATTRLKMVPPTSVRYIRVDAAAPAPHHLPSRFLPEPTPPSHAGSSLWDDIVDHLPIP